MLTNYQVRHFTGAFVFFFCCLRAILRTRPKGFFCGKERQDETKEEHNRQRGIVHCTSCIISTCCTFSLLKVHCHYHVYCTIYMPTQISRDRNFYHTLAFLQLDIDFFFLACHIQVAIYMIVAMHIYIVKNIKRQGFPRKQRKLNPQKIFNIHSYFSCTAKKV